ncbi:hypothetical protein A2U01_0060908, partial [Trifolium medium]|nr:hypothetical protein [Trifolium medium]
VEFLRRISNIWFGSFKLRVNLAKFKKGAQPTTKVEVREGKKVVEHGGHVGRSFKEVVSTEESWRGKEDRVVEESGEAPANQVCLVEERGRVQTEVTEVVWEVEVDEASAAKLEGAYVGYLV